MNERIKQLAEQAGIKEELVVMFKGDFQSYVLSKDDVEKFAELIVRECCQFEKKYSGDAELVARHFSRRIRKHFGVEE